MTVDTVLFDLDLTLCVHRQDADTVLTSAFNHVGVTQFCDTADLASVTDGIPTAENDIEFYRLCLEAAAEQADVAVDQTDTLTVARAYDDYIDHTDVEFLPGAKAVVNDLRSEYALGLVTNGGRETQQAKLNALGITDAFDVLVFATLEKGVKPDPHPFERALAALDATPERTVNVGDSPRADVAGANAIGIKSVWIPRDDTDSVDGIEPDHTLDSLADLPALLNG